MSGFLQDGLARNFLAGRFGGVGQSGYGRRRIRSVRPLLRSPRKRTYS